MKGELINMTLAWDKENVAVPNSNRTHDLPNTWWTLYPLSYENSWRAKSYVTGILQQVDLSLAVLVKAIADDKLKIDPVEMLARFSKITYIFFLQLAFGSEK